MSWDDDEDAWDAEDIEAKFEAQLKEKEKAKRREEGLTDSESEEEATAASPKAKASSEPKAKPKPKPKAADKKKSAAEKKEEPASQGPLTQEEKLRRQKMVEEADARLANDLFSGCEKPSLVDKEKEEQARKAREAAQAAAEASKPKVIVKDAWDEVELNVQADVEKLCTTCLDKLNKSQTKSVAVKFLSDCLKQLEASFDLKELGEVDKCIAEVVKVKTQERGQRLSKDNKANTKMDKHTKFNASDEWEEVYGGGEGDEEWTQEEWDEWYKTQK